MLSSRHADGFLFANIAVKEPATSRDTRPAGGIDIPAGARENGGELLRHRGEGLAQLDRGEGIPKWSKIMKKVSPHTFRHTCATLMLRNKANIRHIVAYLLEEDARWVALSS